MSKILDEYFEALERLKRGKPLNVPKNIRITNDSVSQEAGRKKGSIKKARPMFYMLIEAIEDAARLQRKSEDKMSVRLAEAQAEAEMYRRLWDEALAREISLVKELWDSRASWAKERDAMVNGKITPINRHVPSFPPS